jgi:hypothetical protein
VTDFPFISSQVYLDQKGAIAISIAIQSFGPAFQILKAGVDEKGWFIDLAAQLSPSADWIEEMIRKASRLINQPWDGISSMTGANLREYWRHKGQHLRAQGFLPSMVEIITVEGFIEPLTPIDGEYVESEPLLDPIAAHLSTDDCYELYDAVKGHQDKVWRLSGRTFESSRYLKTWNRYKKANRSFDANLDFPTSFKNQDNPVLKGAALSHVLQHERIWQDFLLEKFPETTIRSHQRPKKINSWWLGGYREVARQRQEPLFQQKLNSSLDLSWRASEEELIEKFSCVLHQIFQVAKMLELEVKATLFVNDQSQIDFWQKLFDSKSEAESCLIDLQLPNEERFILWGFDTRGYWWPLNDLRLLRQKQAMLLEGSVIGSFERWAALSLQAANRHISRA